MRSSLPIELPGPRRIIYDPNSIPILTWNKKNPAWLYKSNVPDNSGNSIIFTSILLKNDVKALLSYSVPNDGDELLYLKQFNTSCSNYIACSPLYNKPLNDTENHIDNYYRWDVLINDGYFLEQKKYDEISAYITIFSFSLNAYICYFEDGIPLQGFKIIYIDDTWSHKSKTTIELFLEDKRTKKQNLRVRLEIKFPCGITPDTVQITSLINWLCNDCQGNLLIKPGTGLFSNPSDEFCFVSELKYITG